MNPNPTTYSAAITGLVPVASATDIFTITGAANKRVTVKKISISGIATAAAEVVVQLMKRSTADTGGTATNPTKVAHNSGDGTASATIAAYTANPTTGNLVGLIESRYVSFSTTATTGDVPVALAEFPNFEANEIVLLSASEVLAVNLNGVTVTGGLINLTITWTEE